jgi:hypothetical protein
MPHRPIPLLACAALLACTAPPGDPPTNDPAAPTRIVLMSDPHITASDYECCENGELDTESIYKSNERLAAARDAMHLIEPRPEAVFVLGDIFHQGYKSEELSFYLEQESAPGNAAALFDSFEIPVHLAWGNHDYEVPEFERSFSHELFRELFGVDPYHSVDVGGHRFLLSNSQLGSSWDPTAPDYDTSFGSFGRDQLAWMAQQLDEGVPTFLMFHHPPYVVAKDEDPTGPYADLFALIEAYRDVIAGVFVGHTHRWIDLTAGMGLPTFVVGSTRYDADNFWLIELDEGGGWEVLDQEKAGWGTVYAEPWDYASGSAVSEP